MAIGDPREVKQAKAAVRAKEAEVWNDREASGRASLATEKAAQKDGGEDGEGKPRERKGQSMGG